MVAGVITFLRPQCGNCSGCRRGAPGVSSFAVALKAGRAGISRNENGSGDTIARRAILMSLDQEDYMRALVGDDDSLWKPLPGFFTPGPPLYTENGGEILKGPRRLDVAKRLLAESGYSGQPITCLMAQDLQITKAQGDVTADLLKRLGVNVEFNAIDWGTNAARRAQKTPPGQGGWHMFHTWHAGAVCVDPSSYTAIRANGDKAWFGWPTIPKVEAEIDAWYEAKT